MGTCCSKPPRVSPIYQSRRSSNYNVSIVVPEGVNLCYIYDDIYHEANGSIWGRIGPVQASIIRQSPEVHHISPIITPRSPTPSNKPLIIVELDSTIQRTLVSSHPYSVTKWNLMISQLKSNPHNSVNFPVQYHLNRTLQQHELRITSSNIKHIGSFIRALLYNY